MCRAESSMIQANVFPCQAANLSISYIQKVYYVHTLCHDDELAL